MWDAVKAVLKGKFTALNGKESFKTNHLSFHLRK